MELTKDFLEGLISTARQEQSDLRAKHLRQDGAIALCEMLLKKISEEPQTT